jgi:hypothetical protein
MSLAEFLVLLFYLAFAIDCMFVIDFGFSVFAIDRLRCHEWHCFDLKQVCVVYVSRYSVFYFREPRFPTTSMMEPRYPNAVNPENPWLNPDNPS